MVLSTTLNAQYSENDLLKEANALFDKGEYSAAMPLYSQLLSLNPTKPEFNYKYGATALYGDADKKEEAIKYLRYASTKYDIDNKCWYFLGRAYHLNYQFADAIRAYNKFKVLAGNKDANAFQVDREIEDCQNGQNLLANIKDVKVLDKIKSTEEAFFRLYDLSEIGGRILVTPEELLTPLDKKLNHKSLIHYRGSGTTVYFSSHGRDGKNGLDIYSAEVLPDGKFSTPVLLGPNINTPYDEDFPFLHADNQSFYFSSKGHSSMGGYDIFRSSLVNGSFSNPENLDFAVNTPDDDLFYMVDSTKTIANFASARSSKQGELHVYKVLVNSIPADITFVKGSFINEISPTNKLAKITVVDAATNKQIDVQYTDPQSGDYVLSFPRSGRFKFSVEAEKSNRVHSGIVDIPKSSGINAYLQEMELVSSAGVEKLLINNLFDQHYDGDVSALAQNLLKQRAALDINFNAQDEPAEPEPVVQVTTENIDLAYNVAGFGAGMSNQKVLEAARERSADLQSKRKEIVDLKQAAEQRYFKALASANTESEVVKELLEQIQTAEDSKKGELMFKAGLAKMEAEQAVREASNIQDLITQLSELEAKVTQDEQASEEHVKTIELSFESNDYDKVVNALKAEKSIQENQDKTVNEYDAVRHMQLASLESRKDAQKYLDRASSMRDQSNKVQNTLMNKQTLRARSKGKEAKALDEEIQRLTIEANEINERVTTAFNQAANVQEQSYNKDQQYDIISELEEQVQHPDYELGVSEMTSGAHAQSLSEVRSQVADFDIDPELVSKYLKDNPNATDHLDSDQIVSQFWRTYGAGDPQTAKSKGDVLAYQDKSEPVGFGQNEVDELPQANAPTESSAGTDGVGIAKGENEIHTAKEGLVDPESDSEPLAELEKGDDQTREELFGFEHDSLDAPLGGTQKNSGEKDTESTSNADLEFAQTGMEVGKLGEEPKDKADSEELFEITEIQSSNHNEDRVDAIATDNTDLASDSDATGVQTSQKEEIAAEEAKIAAAEDWIAIIDASIADLEKGLGASDGENIDEQLKQYRTLKRTKEKEIAASESKIANLYTPGLKKEPTTALARTESDLDTLSVSHIARLEMRISDIAHEKRYQDRINFVNPEYLSELSEIEMSGKSNPEIATERLALNKAFIEQIDALFQDENKATTKDDLLELRRIKGLEVRQDRLIQTGEFAYTPRSKEAIDYVDILASVPDEKSTEVSSQDNSEWEGLSPELAAEIKLPFSRSALVENYDSQKENIEATYSDEKLLSERIALNNELYKTLKKEIEIYEAAMQTASSTESGELILARYSTLLAERSDVVGEIEADQIALKNYSDLAVAKPDRMPEIAKPKTEEPLEVFIDSDEETQEEVIIVETDPDVVARDHVADYENEYNRGLQAIESMNYNERRKLEEIASLNAVMANKIDSTVNVLVSELDKPGTQIDKDNLQVQIQNLDAIAADKRQEADRLLAESQLVALSINTESEQGSETDLEEAHSEEAPVANAEIPTPAQDIQPIDVSAMEAEWEENLKISDLKYKSLNANIAVNSISPIMESLAKEKSEARELAMQINSLSEPAERANAMAKLEILNSGIKDLQDKIQTEVATSNAAEIDFFQSSNEDLFKYLNDIAAPAEIELDKIALATRQTELNQELSAIESRFSKNEITLNERIEEEVELIGELSELNQTLEAEVRRLEPEGDTVEIAGAEPVVLGRYGDDEVLMSMMSVPENYVPEPGKTYVTPVHSYVNASLSDAKKAELARNDSDVEVDFDFVLNPSDKEDESLLRSKTVIDEKRLDLLRENKNQYKYLLASLKADSLKHLEKKQAEFAIRMDNESMEKFAEVKRLNGMIEMESHPKLKADLEARVDRIISEATVNYQKSAMASFQAEKLKNLRREQELEIAHFSSKLSSADLAEVNEALSGEVYKVVPSDFDTAELSKEKPKLKGVEKAKADDKKESDNLELIEEKTIVEIAESTPVTETPEATETLETTELDTRSDESLASNEITVNANLHSIDEQLLLETHGNWLNVFEVIAYKDDFSDVKEALFVKSDGSVYNENTPIPINPTMPAGLVFQVQVGAFRNNIPQDLFGDFAPVMAEELPNGITRYRAGIFKAYKGAIVARNEIRERGYSDAFVVAYINGERLTGTQAQHILEQARVDEGMTLAETRIKPDPAAAVSEPIAASISGTSNQTEEGPIRTDYYNDPDAAEANLVETTSGLFFTVQVGVYSKPVKLDALYNLVELNSELTAGGYIRYTSGRYTSTETAEIRKSEVIEKGVTDAFITAYYNGKRISAARAQSILEEQGHTVLSPAIGNKSPVSEPVSAETPEDNVKYVVILGSYAGDIPQNVANIFLERSDLKIRRVTAPNGVSIYASPEFDTREAAEDFLKLSKAAGVESALMGKVVDGRISAVDSK